MTTTAAASAPTAVTSTATATVTAASVAISQSVAPTAAAPSAAGMVHVPASSYTVGQAEADVFHVVTRTIKLPAYWIDSLPVNNAQYKAYLAGSGRSAPYCLKDGALPFKARTNGRSRACRGTMRKPTAHR